MKFTRIAICVVFLPGLRSAGVTATGAKAHLLGTAYRGAPAPLFHGGASARQHLRRVERDAFAGELRSCSTGSQQATAMRKPGLQASRFRPTKLAARAGSRQHESAKVVDESRTESIVLDQETHVDGAVQRIKDQVEVGVFAKFAAANGAMKGRVRFATAWPQEAVAKSSNQVFVALAGSEDGRDDASARTLEDFDELAHLLAHVGINRAGIGEAKPARGAAGKCIGDQRALIWPPAVHGGLADRGSTGYIFNGEIGESRLCESLQRAAQNGDAGLFAARPARGTLAVVVLTVCGHRGLVAHGPNLPYNRSKFFGIRYAEYRI